MKQTEKTREKINGTKSQFFEKVNKTDKPLARLSDKKGGKALIKPEMKEKKQQISQKYRKI